MKNKVLIVLCGAVAALAGTVMSADAVVRVSNASRGKNQQTNTVTGMRPGAMPNSPSTVWGTPADMVPVLNDTTPMAETDERLTECKMIYPNGEFIWARPSGGIRAGAAPMCVSVVELRGYQMGFDGSDVVFARANIAPGDAINCNISDFPEFGYTDAAGEYEFPADAEPTRDDVIAVMNQEQKKGAGYKIAAGVLAMGAVGNMIGRNEAGKSGVFGTGKNKLITTSIGAAGGAALMAASAYSGKVPGDIIESAGVNAAAGAVGANILAGQMGSGTRLRVELCKDTAGNDTHCLWGMYAESEDSNAMASYEDRSGTTPQTKDYKKYHYNTAFYNIANDSAILCEQVKEREANYNGGVAVPLDPADEDKDGKYYRNCKSVTLVNVKLDGYTDVAVSSWKDSDRVKVKDKISGGDISVYCRTQDGEICKEGDCLASDTCDDNTQLLKIDSFGRVTKQQPAAIILGKDTQLKGYTSAKWKTFKDSNANPDVYLRNSAGNLDGKIKVNEDGDKKAIDKFYPMYESATDGDIVDFGNRARLGGTLTGAAVGAGLGGYTAYQAAQDDIDSRWAAAVREYKDSLTRVYCATGTRFLSQYNSMAKIDSLEY